MKTLKEEDMKCRIYNKMLFLLLAVAGMSGCVREDIGSEPPTPSNGNQVTITATVPGLEIPTTRSMDGVPEAAIKTIDLLLFDITPKLIKRVEIAESEITYVGGADYKVTLEATLLDNTVTVVMIANASAEVSTAAVMNNSKAVVLAALIHKTLSGKWNANPTNKAAPVAGTDYTPIPMCGEIAKSDIGGSKKIELTRMLARVDVKNSASDFKVLEISVVNYNTQGNIAPAWGTGGKILESGDSGYPYANNVNPPAPTSGWGKKIGEKLTYTTTLAVGQEYSGEIYLYEAVKNPNATMSEDDAHKEAICLIVKGTWTDTDLGDGDQSGTYYYRIDFTAAQGALQKPEDVEYMPVYRNHLYTFNISAVNGVGFPATAAGFESALKSFGVLNNMKTKLHVVNQSGIKNMVFDGEHFIGIGDDARLEFLTNSVGDPVPCVTNYWEGWSIEKIEYEMDYEDDNGNWLTTNPAVGANPNPSNNSIVLTTTSENKIPDDRKAYVYIKAGLLTYKLTVTQKEGLLYVGRFGGELALNANGEWGFTEELWIQAYEQNKGATIQWSFPPVLTNVNDRENGRKNTFLLKDTPTNFAVYECYKKNTNTILDEFDLAWFLPSKMHLLAAWVSYSSYREDLRPKAAASPLTIYMSSTEWYKHGDTDNNNGDNVYGQRFDTGASMTPNKKEFWNMRCAREFKN